MPALALDGGADVLAARRDAAPERAGPHVEPVGEVENVDGDLVALLVERFLDLEPPQQPRHRDEGALLR